MITLNAQQYLKEDLLILSCYFTIFYLMVFFLSCFKTSCAKKHVYHLYCIFYTLNFCYVMYNMVLEICIDRRLLEDCFYCYSQQVISAVANEFLIPYTIIIIKSLFNTGHIHLQNVHYSLS